jgi:hypothetical protein
MKVGAFASKLGKAIWVRVPDTHWILDLMGMGTGTRTIFYLRVAPVLDPNRDEYGMSIFFHTRVTRWVLDTFLPL